MHQSQCTRCGSLLTNDSQYCTKCGYNPENLLNPPRTAVNSDTGQQYRPFIPPASNKKKGSLTLIPGLGALFGIRRDPQTGRLSCAPTCSAYAILGVVLIIGAILVGHQLSTPQPSLKIIGGNPVPGGSVNVRGSGFPPGSSVSITLDGTPVTSTNQPSITSKSYSISITSVARLFAGQVEQVRSLQGTVTVNSDGTFDATIAIPSNWNPGSDHIIQAQALAQDGTVTAQAQLPVVMQAGIVQGNTPTPTPSPSPTPPLTVSPPAPLPAHLTVSSLSLNFGSVQHGQSARQQLTISNSGGQALDWTTDTSGANGVTLDISKGTLSVNDSNRITVTLDTSQLQAGPYNVTLTINSSNADNAPVQVTITATVVQVTITSPSSPPQLNLNSDALTFDSPQDSTGNCSIPASQSVTVTNSGGGTLTWTIGTPNYTSSPSSQPSDWLTASGDGSNAPSTVTFNVNVGNLPHVNGAYTATVAITPSSGSVQNVLVTLNVSCFIS